MSDRKRFWEGRLETRNDRAAWYEDLVRRHLFAEVNATDLQCRSDEFRTMFLLGQRSTALAEFQEASRLVPRLVGQTFAEALTPPPARQETNEDGSSAGA